MQAELDEVNQRRGKIEVTLRQKLNEANQQVKEEKPPVVNGSPPCTPLSQLQTLNPNTYEKERGLRQGEEYMRFMISIYRLQVEGGRLTSAPM